MLTITARGLITALEKGKPGEKYNFGGNSERNNLTVVKLICDTLDCRLLTPTKTLHQSLITFVTDRPGHDHRYAIDASKAGRELGWHPKETFESGIESTIAWYLKNRAWWQPLRQNVYRGERLGLVAAG